MPIKRKISISRFTNGGKRTPLSKTNDRIENKKKYTTKNDTTNLL